MDSYITNSPNLRQASIHPNPKKLLAANAIKLFFLLIVVIICIFILKKFLSFEGFSVVFELLKIEVNPTKIFFQFIGIAIGLILLILLFNYISARKISCEFSDDAISITTPKLLLLSESVQIPYQNIVKVAFSNKDLFNKLFNTGTISIELSAMKQDKAQIEFIDNVEQAAQTIQSAIVTHNQVQQAQFTEQYKMDSIFNRYMEDSGQKF